MVLPVGIYSDLLQTFDFRRMSRVLSSFFDGQFFSLITILFLKYFIDWSVDIANCFLFVKKNILPIGIGYPSDERLIAAHAVATSIYDVIGVRK